jgi:multiple sugar transport system substrate-binding protein
MRKTLFYLASLLAIISMVAACGGAGTPVVQTVVVKETAVVKETSVVTVKETAEPLATAVPQADRTQIFWYIGLGAGAQPAQIPLEKAFVKKFNDSQKEIQLIDVIVDNRYARDNLTTQLAAGNAPDIVGPVGTAGRASFPGAFLDLQPLVEKFKYDVTDIDPAFMDFYKVEGKLEGLPFAIYPSAIYVNKTLFDEAKLAYPPQKVGDKYTFEGKDYDWDFNTVAMVARKLTVDANGADATDPKFDRTKIVQYGFNMQWNDDPRAFGNFFCANYPVKDGKAYFPDCWKEGWKWYYDAIWGKQPFLPNDAAVNGDLLKGNAFSSGKVAMAETHLWYTCCIDVKNVTSMDAAIAPSWNGKITAKMHGDTFAIMAASKNPDLAFKVYTYMLGEGSADLYGIYGGLPARKSQQAAFLAGLDKTFAPSKVNWQVFIDMIPNMDVPNHELGLPNNAQANDAFNAFGTQLRTNEKLDMDKAIADFETTLNGIYAAAK